MPSQEAGRRESKGEASRGLRSLCRLAVLLILAPSSFAGAQAPSTSAGSATDPDLTPPALRLPAGVRPTRYDLDLFVDPEGGGFHGTVGIYVQVEAPTRVIWLHGQDLRELSALIGKREAKVHLAEGGYLAVVAAEPVPAGAARLTLRFTGTLDSQGSKGIYRVAEPDGKQYAYTLFEPVDARRAFPCFDEPSFKVPWKLTLRTPEASLAAANAPLAAERREETTRIFEFAETPPLPSYLIAFVVGPFDVVEAGTAGRHGTPLRFILPPGRRSELAYAKEVTPKVVGLLEDWFGMPYPFKKLDVAVVARRWGTMEHPGLVAMGQPLTLIKPEDDTVWRRLDYANILVHELAHYWFGDYVTLAWWDEAWLNEGLAEWMDVKITAAVEPAWRYERNRQRLRKMAMTADGLASAKAMRQPVRERTDILGSFDNNLTYFKGASVMWMFERWAGIEAFQRGVRAYLQERAWGNAVTEDLLAALSKATGRDLGPTMKSFIDQPGVPEIGMSLTCVDGSPPAVRLTQRRYQPLGSPAPPGAAEARWNVPLCLRWGRGDKTAERCALLDAAQADWELDGVGGCPDWLLGNAGGAGYYYTAYSEPLRRKLIAGFGPASGVLRDTDERRTLVTDVAAQVAAGNIDAGEALALVPPLLADSDLNLVQDGLNLLDLINRDALPDALQPHYQRMGTQLLAARAKEIGWGSRPGEPIELHELRPALIRRAADASEDKAFYAEARRLVRLRLADRKATDPDMDIVILNLAARHGDATLFDAILAEALRTSDRADRPQLLTSLGSFQDPTLLARALQLLLDPKIDLRDALGILRPGLRRRETRDQVWTFYRQHFSELAARVDGMEKMGLIWVGILPLCDAKLREEAKALLTEPVSQMDGGPLLLANSLEAVDQCIATRERNAAGIAAFLKAY